MDFVSGRQQPLSSILDAVTDGIIAQDHTGKLIYANAAAARLLNFASSEALLAVPLAELLPRFDTIDAYGHLLPLKQFPAQLVLQGEANPQMTLRFRIPVTNDEFWFIAEAKPVFDERGDVAFAVNSFHDITQLKQSEQFRRRQEDELRDFVENAAISLHWVDPEGLILWATQAELDLLGYTREEYFGHHIAEFHVDQSVIQDILNCLSSGQTLHNREARMRCKDGSIRYVLIDSNVMWEDGKFMHTRCFTRDVTSQPQAKQTLEESRLRLQAIFDNVQNAIVVADDAGHLVEANPAACLLTGYSLEELLKLSVKDITAETEWPSVSVSWDAFLHREHQYGDHTIRRKDGMEIATEYRAVANVLPGLHLSLIQDVSERKRTEQELRGRFSQLQAIYELSSAVNRAEKLEQVYTIALEGLVDHLGANRGSILLFDADGVMRFKAWRGLSDSYRRQTEGHSPWTRDTLNAQPVLISDVREEASLEPLRAIIVEEGIRALGFIPLLSDGNLLGKFMIYYDCPHEFKEAEMQFVQTLASHVAFAIERQSMEQTRIDLLRREHLARLEAEKADALKLQFLAMISHELRTPLTSIKGFTSTLLAEDVTFDLSTQRDFLSIMDQEADKLTDLIGQLIDVSRLQARTLRIQPTEQAFVNAVNVSRIQLQVLTRNHHLRLDIPDALPPVMMDEQRIAQVLVNLVDNAVKYSPPDTSILVQARKVGTTIEVAICDEGEGVPPEARRTIFEAFRQVDKDTRQSGAGLGLAICKGLVEAHRGKIWIEDRATFGTCVVFTLPIS